MRLIINNLSFQIVFNDTVFGFEYHSNTLTFRINNEKASSFDIDSNLNISREDLQSIINYAVKESPKYNTHMALRYYHTVKSDMNVIHIPDYLEDVLLGI